MPEEDTSEFNIVEARNHTQKFHGDLVEEYLYSPDAFEEQQNP